MLQPQVSKSSGLASLATDPIDAVITWVDGHSPRHRALRTSYQAKSERKLHENAINPHRWLSQDEIYYCLQSIDNHAPWVRYVWIVVDQETPDLSKLPPHLRDKVKIALHREIFGPQAHVLPTFNSLSIETMLWRIDGLSDRFLYFNDDVFLAATLAPSDVFQGRAPVLRGKWVDYSAIETDPSTRADPAMFNHFMQLNAARLGGFPASRLFASAHVVHPMRRDVMAQLYDQHRTSFQDNIRHRFRDLTQFLPQGLHSHACIASGNAVLQPDRDHLHVKSGQGLGAPPSETRKLLQSALDPRIKFLCVNDLAQLEQVIPDASTWLAKAIGGFPGGPNQAAR